jgi:hypothetical protein
MGEGGIGGERFVVVCFKNKRSQRNFKIFRATGHVRWRVVGGAGTGLRRRPKAHDVAFLPVAFLRKNRPERATASPVTRWPMTVNH